MKRNKLSLLALTVAGAMTVAAGAVAAKPLAPMTSPKDPGVINKERILYWAQKRGELAADASVEAKNQYLRQYVAHAKAISARNQPELAAMAKARANKAAKSRAGNLDFTEKTVKVLTVLIDFPDLPHDDNRLSRADTDMYYDDYNVAHYEGLMFSQTGFAGPSGQNFLSAYQYYQAESGASLHFTGGVYDWVTADNNAAHYGGNEGEDDNDRAVRDLIKEAVTKVIAANPDVDWSEYDQEDQYDLDEDGNLEEPDGIIDHVMVFHSSVGEEAGGGVLNADAIWSHRWTVGGAPYAIPGSTLEVFGYTIQPIDAATGVVAHEFGHDLGLPDEYDTAGSDMGEPIGFWSIMSGGSWAGSVPGSEPTGFSPYARDLFQQWYGGNWVNQTVFALSELQSGSETVDLVAAVNHDGGVNQVRVDLPANSTNPFAGSFQFASGHANMSTRSLSFDVAVPASANAQLRMRARWNIEQDYDYAQVLVNGTAIAGTSTIGTSNPEHDGITNYLTGVNDANWNALTFSLASFQGQNVTITLRYVTDQSVGGFGMLVDNIEVANGAAVSFSADAEVAGQVTLNGFSRTGSYETAPGQQYYVQLRDHSGVDVGLLRESHDHGLVMWFADPNYSDNNVEIHPGHGFLAVIDADQQLMRSGSIILDSGRQVRDAAFRRMAQSSKSNDSFLGAIFSFDDRYDYSSPESPQSGVVLPQNAFSLALTEQANDSSSARVVMTANAGVAALAASINNTTNGLAVNFTATASGGEGALSYLWNFGDNQTSTQASPSHTYASAGTYTVSLTITDARGFARTVNKSVTVSGTNGGGGSGGGGGGGSFASLGLLLLAGFGWRRRA